MPNLLTTRPLRTWTLGVFHNHNLSNLDSTDSQIHLLCDKNLNPDYESVDLPSDSLDYP